MPAFSRFRSSILILPILAIFASAGCCSNQSGKGGMPDGVGFPCDEPVRTTAGLLRGFADGEGETCSWIGVPFAAAPVGDLRWKAPEPVPEWEGVRNADRWGDICMQSWLFKVMHMSPAEMSEECLNLNVWRPARPGKFPVMVFFHGGANIGGSGSTPLYRGDRLSGNQDVVVVTVNYRLGPFGFLFHEEFTREDPAGAGGNFGVLDQIAALRWVRNNIAGFGGDPGNVTIFGESAGGWAVCALMASPLARGLFHRAIIESGGCQSIRRYEESCRDGAWAAGRLGCGANDLACMRKQSARKVLKKLGTSRMKDIAEGTFRYLYHRDGGVFPGSPLELIRSGDFHNVPLLAGSNRDETKAVMYLKPWQVFMSEPSYRTRVAEKVSEDADRVIGLYPPGRFGGPAEALFAIASDVALGCPTYEGVRAVAEKQKKVFYYRFDYDEAQMGSLIGAAHLLEVPFVFSNFDRKPLRSMYAGIKGEKLENRNELSRIIQGYWANFARAGDPNGEGLPPWPAFSGADPKVQVLDTSIRTEAPDNSERCAFWSKYFQDNPRY